MGPEQEDKVKMVVAGITLDQSNNMPIIILRGEEEEVAIPIWIGLIEASAIATELEGIALPRPMTHDLLKNVLETMGGRVLRVEVSDLRENTFYAVLYIEQIDKFVAIIDSGHDDFLLWLVIGFNGCFSFF